MKVKGYFDSDLTVTLSDDGKLLEFDVEIPDYYGSHTDEYKIPIKDLKELMASECNNVRWAREAAEEDQS